MAVYGVDDSSTNCVNENKETIDTTSTNHNSVLDDMLIVPLAVYPLHGAIVLNCLWKQSNR